ncbi:hypothetical protein D3C81_2136400 [compost metagenome]
MGAGADLEVAAVGEGIAVQAVGHQQFAGLGAQLDPRLLRIWRGQGAGAGAEQRQGGKQDKGAHGGLRRDD